MKRLMSMLLILLLAVGLCAPAAGGEGYQDQPKKTFKVVYTTHDGQNLDKRPEATFTFTVEAGTNTGSSAAYPAQPPTIDPVVFDATAIADLSITREAVIDLPEYDNVGVYEYTIQQVDPKISGVDCHADPIRLIVQVIQDDAGQLRIAAVHCETGAGEEKSDTITNTYGAGSLTVKKVVTGNMGDKTKYFDVTVTLTAPADGTTLKPAVGVDPLSGEGNPTEITYGVPATFSIKHDESIVLTNIVAGTTYVVTEANYTGPGPENGYDTAQIDFADTNKIIDSGDKDQVTVTNNKGINVDTGISLDNAPYLLLLALVLVAGVALLLKRRRRERD